MMNNDDQELSIEEILTGFRELVANQAQEIVVLRAMVTKLRLATQVKTTTEE